MGSEISVGAMVGPDGRFLVLLQIKAGLYFLQRIEKLPTWLLINTRLILVQKMVKVSNIIV